MGFGQQPARTESDYVANGRLIEGAAQRDTPKVLELASRNTRASTLPIKLWQPEVVQSLCRIVELPAGWDTYGANPVSPETSMFALQVLQSVMRDRTPAPAIVPTPKGGIQLEWHTPTIDLEIYIERPYAGEMVFEDRRDGIEIEVAISSDLRPIYEMIGILTVR